MHLIYAKELQFSDIFLQLFLFLNIPTTTAESALYSLYHSNGHSLGGVNPSSLNFSYLHSTGYAVIPVHEGFVVMHCPEGVTVEDEDGLRDLYHEWSTRKSRTPGARIGRCPFQLNNDARAAVALAAAGDGPHTTIASEYIAFRDWKEGIDRYDTDTMHATILTATELSEADPHALTDAAADVLGSAEREEDENLSEYLEDLGMRLKRLA